MPNQIRDLRALVPEDVVFQFPNGTYAIPGDLDVETTFELLALLQELGEADTAEGNGSQDLEKIRAVSQKLSAMLLRLFQIRQPELEALPFGLVGLRLVTAEILKTIGLLVETEEVEENPLPPRPSQRSRGSRRSATSST
jgi:hypothetical protein